ncbi:MAG: hypothetical protein K940chlam3_01501 [Chlamydiae bacterium]|nr:hypothetical protein [Chlamydiota bacterium]
MKIFWSWQSDSPDEIGRNFVRKALEKAIEELRDEIQIEEPDRLDRKLHLDYDRKGVPGSPDLANTILKKIRESVVFVADVTPVGKTPRKKRIMNPNVAIELGYALAKIGDEGILMVLNSAYGSRESLPFDLRHKYGPIIYSLKPDSTKEDYPRIQSPLSDDLKDALRECLDGAKERRTDNNIDRHEETPTQGNPAQYSKESEILAELSDNQITYRAVPILYLRAIPTIVTKPLRGDQIKDIIFGIKIKPLRQSGFDGASWDRNAYGGITYSFAGQDLFTTSQIFPNREIWGLDTTLLAREKTIPSFSFEELFESGLKHYLEVAKGRLRLKLPLIIEAGAVGVKGFKMEMGNAFRPDYLWGPIHQSEIRSRHMLMRWSVKDVNQLLLDIFKDFFGAVGERRPNHFRGFPPERIED